MTSKPPLRTQRGFVVQSLGVILVVLAIIMVGVARQKLIAANREAGASMGFAVDQVVNGLTRYRKDNFLTLTSASPNVTGFANPMAPTVAELKAKGYLNAAVSANLGSNSYGMGIYKQPSGCVGPSATCEVFSTLWLVNPVVDSVSGNPDTHRLSSLLASVHDSASYSSLPNTALITGNKGGWSLPNPDATNRAGIVMVVSGLGGDYPAFLQVGDPRDPAFTGNATVAGYIKPSAGPGQTVTAGTACTEPTGAMKNDAGGRVLSCQSGIWTGPDGSKAMLTQAPVNNVPGGTSFAVKTCPAGGTPWATYAAQLSAVNDTVIPPYQGVVYTVSQVGGNWVTLTQANKPSASPVTVDASNYVSLLGSLPIGVFTAGCSFS